VEVPQRAYVWAQAGDELGKEVFVAEILLGIAALLTVLCVGGSGKAHLWKRWCVPCPNPESCSRLACAALVTCFLRGPTGAVFYLPSTAHKECHLPAGQQPAQESQWPPTTWIS
jgi:hypothetical protein